MDRSGASREACGGARRSGDERHGATALHAILQSIDVSELVECAREAAP